MIKSSFIFSERYNCNDALKMFNPFILFFFVGAQLDKIGFTVIKKCISAVETRGNDQPSLYEKRVKQLVCPMKKACVVKSPVDLWKRLYHFTNCTDQDRNLSSPILLCMAFF